MKKKIITGISLFIISLAIVFSVAIKNIKDSTNYILTNLVKTNVRVGDIKVKGLSIHIDNIDIKDLDKNDVGYIKSANIKINPFLPSRISSIKLSGGYLKIVQNKDKSLNIENIIKKNDNVNRTFSIANIIVSNMRATYINKSFTKEIKKDLVNVKGNMKLLLESKFNINLIGEIDKNNSLDKEIVGITLKKIPKVKNRLFSIFSFKKIELENYSAFTFKNVSLDETLTQFAPINFVSVDNGKINGDIKILKDNFKGSLLIESNSVRVKDFDGKFEKSKVNIDFLGDEIFAKAMLFEDVNMVKLTVKYKIKEKEMNLKANFNDMPFTSIEKYKKLKDLNLNAKGNVDFSIDLNMKDKKISSIITKVKSDKINIKGIDFKNVLLETKDNVLADLNFDIVNRYIKEHVKVNLDLDLDSKKGKGNLNISDKLKADININSYSDMDLKADDDKLKLLLSLKDKIVSLDLETKKSINTILGKYKLNFLAKSNDLKYDISNKELSGSLDVKGKYKDNDIILNMTAKDSMIYNTIQIDNEFSKLNLIGTTDKNLEHKYLVSGNIKGFNVDANLFGNKLDLNTKFVISAKKYKNTQIEVEGLKLIGQANDIIKNPNVTAKANVFALWYNYHRLKDINADIKFKDNMLLISDINNEFLNMDVFVDFKTKEVKAEGKLKNYMLYTTKNPDINILVDELSLNLGGTIHNPKLTMQLTPSKFSMNKKFLGYIVADANLRGNLLEISSKLNDNYIYGYYNILDKSVDFNIKANQGLKDIINFDNIDAKLKGNIKVKGKAENIYSDIILELRDINYKDYKIPNITLNADYQNGNIQNLLKSGILNIKSFKVSNNKSNEIIYDNSMVLDLSNLNLDYNLENKIIDLSTFGDNLQGKVKLNIKLNGNFDKFFAAFSLESDEININNNRIENIILDAQVTESAFNINQGYLEYEKNPIFIEGTAYFKPNVNYTFRVLADEFNINFLNIYKGITNAKGIANLDFIVNKNSVDGRIKLDDFSISTKEYNVQNFNVDIGLNNKDININDFKGFVNKGKVYANGGFSLPTLADDFLTTNKVNLGKFDVDIVLDKVTIPFKDNEVVLSTNLQIEGEEIKGNITLNKTKINNFDFIEKTKKQKNKVNNYVISRINAIIDNMLKQYYVNVDLNIAKPVVIDVPSYLVLKDIYGELQGSAKLLFSNGHPSVEGKFYIDQGKFSVNANDFTIETFGIEFNDFDRIDPYINLKASTVINGEEIYIFMNSKLSERLIEYKSQTNKSKDEILSLLAFKGSAFKLESASAAGKNFINVATETVINQFISKITNKIGKKIGLTKFEVNANIIDKNKLEVKDFINNASVDIKLQGDLWKEKNINWNVKTTLPLGAKKVDDLGYDLSVSYKVKKGLDVNVGIKSNKNDFSEATKGLKNVNFYTGVNYSKKFENFEDFYESVSGTLQKREKLKEDVK